MTEGIHRRETGIEQQDYYTRYKNLENSLDEIKIILKKIERHMAIASDAEFNDQDMED